MSAARLPAGLVWSTSGSFRRLVSRLRSYGVADLSPKSLFAAPPRVIPLSRPGRFLLATVIAILGVGIPCPDCSGLPSTGSGIPVCESGRGCGSVAAGARGNPSTSPSAFVSSRHHDRCPIPCPWDDAAAVWFTDRCRGHPLAYCTIRLRSTDIPLGVPLAQRYGGAV